MTDTRPGLLQRVRAGAIELAYRTWGPAGGPPVVLVHALGEDSSNWVLTRPEGTLPFDWDVTVLSNEFTDPQVSSWRESLRLMAVLIPDCQLVTISAGHLVHAVQPADFTAAVTAFLAREPGSG